MTAVFAQVNPNLEETTLLAGMLIGLAFSIVWGALCYWRLFEKAGKPGWASLIPVYQAMVLADVAKKPMWWGLVIGVIAFVPSEGAFSFLLFPLAIAALVLSILIAIEVCKHFGKRGAGMVILCLLCGIGYMILGFGDAQYDEELKHDKAF